MTRYKLLKRILLLLFWLSIALVVSTRVLLGLFPQMPENLGAKFGRLADCPNSPNCVSTEAVDDVHAMKPLEFEGTAEEAMQAIKNALAVIPRSTIKSETNEYLHVECKSLIFGFVDDVEFLIDEVAGLIHFRSASRVGYSDLGKNRARMEKFCKRFNEQSK